MKRTFFTILYMIFVVLGIYRIVLGETLSAILDLGFAGALYLWLNPRS